MVMRTTEFVYCREIHY